MSSTMNEEQTKNHKSYLRLMQKADKANRLLLDIGQYDDAELKLIAKQRHEQAHIELIQTLINEFGGELRFND